MLVAPVRKHFNKILAGFTALMYIMKHNQDFMQNYFSFESLKKRTVQNKFNIIIGLIILILLFGMVNFWFSMKIMSSIRSYVGGEGLWSKAQKEAANNLVKYSYSHNEADYKSYQNFIKVPMGDKQARLEMNKTHPDLAITRQGFIQGGNDPSDVGDLIFLYQRFRNVSYVSQAIAIWTQGDAEIQNLVYEGDQIHSLVTQPTPVNRVQAANRASQLSELLNQVYDTDKRLTVLENNFSATLGSGSRNINDSLVRLTIVITILLGALTLLVAILIGRAIIRLDRLKTEFVSIASHQLRTPLTSVNWIAEALLTESKGKLNPEQKKAMTELYNSGQRMSNLITDLLRASSLDLGTYKSRLETINVGGTLKVAIKDQQPVLDQKNISVTTNIDENLPRISLDKQLLSVVFQNLLSNSAKYTPAGGTITIDIHAKKTSLLIGVADNGIGIPREQQSQIFGKFFRADNAKEADASNGTGLGLYIVRAMVQMARGAVWFESAENQGTTFYVKLPLYGGTDSSQDKHHG